MSSAQAKIFDTTRNLSTISVASVIILSLILNRQIDGSSITWQVAVALVALAVGIPHGALDHLVALPRTSLVKMTIFIVAYVAAALLAIWAILQWSVIGFIFVVVMSALHFGIGDAAFIRERDRATFSNHGSRLAQTLYALSAGSLPVVIPLTNERSISALAAVNADLVNWHNGWDFELLVAVLIITGLALAVLAVSRRWRDVFDLATLALLALVAPPLVTFAAYFGLWHAMRHTARLTLNLPKSQAAVRQEKPVLAFARAVIPGLPALFGTFIFALLLGLNSSQDALDEFLWLTLVVVWALTVPHMLVTAGLDRKALR
jgi:Brp/Blh family beta-carotene 15,15'-monooxygenase